MDPLSQRTRPKAKELPPAREELRPKLTAVPSGISAPPRPSTLATDGPGSRLDKRALLSLVLGTLGLVSWVVPWVGFPLGFFGLIQGISSKSLGGKTRRSALIGLGFCAISMTLSIANWVVVSYLGSSGKSMLSGILTH